MLIGGIMKRLTSVIEDSKIYVVDSSLIESHPQGVTGAAIQTLAIYENTYEALMKKYEAVTLEMQNLKGQNKTKTVRFKQLLIEKVTTKNILMMFDIYDI